MRCDLCLREGQRGYRAVTSHGRAPIVSACSNREACLKRMVKLADSDPGALIAGRVVLVVKPQIYFTEPEYDCHLGLLITLSDGLTVKVGQVHHSPDEAEIDWQVTVIPERVP